MCSGFRVFRLNAIAHRTVRKWRGGGGGSLSCVCRASTDYCVAYVEHGAICVRLCVCLFVWQLFVVHVLSSLRRCRVRHK